MIAFQLLPRGSPKASKVKHAEVEQAEVVPDHSTPATAAHHAAPRDHISFSSISLFRTCSLRYFFKYVAGLPEEKTSASFVFGRAIHRAAEFHFRELLAGGEASNLDTLLAEFPSRLG